jgi:hypothetical protein
MGNEELRGADGACLTHHRFEPEWNSGSRRAWPISSAPAVTRDGGRTVLVRALAPKEQAVIIIRC